MGWWEWFFPRCPTCLGLRILIFTSVLTALGAYGWWWPLAFGGAAVAFMVIGSAANYLLPIGAWPPAVIAGGGVVVCILIIWSGMHLLPF